MESWHLPNLSVQIAPDCISEYLNFQNFPDPPSKSRLRRSKWALSRPYCQYSELCHARAYKQKKARNAPGLTDDYEWRVRRIKVLVKCQNVWHKAPDKMISITDKTVQTQPEVNDFCLSITNPLPPPQAFLGGFPRGGGHSTKFYTGRLRPEVQTLALFHTLFDRKGTPFRIPSIENCTPCIYLRSDFYQTLHSRNPLKCLDESVVRCVSSRYVESPFQYVNASFPSPFLCFNS